jgi:hypothetical protein
MPAKQAECLNDFIKRTEQLCAIYDVWNGEPIY